MSSQPPLTPAEQAAAEVLAERHNASSSTNRLGVGAFHAEARAVVAAVEPYLTIAALEAAQTAIEQFSARKRKAGHRRDAVGIDEAAELVLDQLRTLRTRLSLSRPTSEETR